MSARKFFSRLKVVGALKRLGAIRFRVTHSTLLQVSLLLLILFIAAMVRLLPIRWGYSLSEFDPATDYRMAKHMVDNGFLSYATWHDPMSWYPHGFNFGVNYGGTAATDAFFYLIASKLGLSIGSMITDNPLNTDPLYNFSVIFPVIMGTLTCLLMYFLGKDFGGKAVGLFAALLLAINSDYIGRTDLGFMRDETVGIFGLVLFIIFFLRSIDRERSIRSSLTYAVAAGLSLGYLFFGTGSSTYPLGLTMIFVFVLLLLRRYSSRLLLSYSVTFGLSLFIAINVPKLGFSFLTQFEILGALGVFLLLCMFEISSYVKTLKMKTVFVFGFFAALVVSALVLLLSGNVAPAAIRSMAALNPGIRLGTGPVQEILQSVQEQRPAAWGTFYYTLGVTAFFVPVGLYFTVQNPTNRNIFLCLFGLTALYFASSLVRLTLILAPAVSLLVALALVRLLNPFITILKEHPIPRRRMRFETHVGKEFSGAFILVILLVLTFTFVIPSPATAFPRFLDQAYSPTTINAASLPIRPNAPVNDWLDALKWMRFNLPPSPPYGPTVVAAWWDYGYWIILYANRTTLCDNGTTNVTQIAQVGLMFMSDETQAITILKRYNVTDVVVFATFDSSGAWEGYGDEGKWRWMARIAGLNDNSYGNYSLGVNQLANSTEVPNALGMNTTIYKLMTYGMETTLSKNITVQFTLNSEGQPYFEEAYFSETPATVQNVLQSCGLVPLVCVYKVNYG